VYQRYFGVRVALAHDEPRSGFKTVSIVFRAELTGGRRADGCHSPNENPAQVRVKGGVSGTLTGAGVLGEESMRGNTLGQ
jgi:hypothetical protein